MSYAALAATVYAAPSSSGGVHPSGASEELRIASTHSVCRVSFSGGVR